MNINKYLVPVVAMTLFMSSTVFSAEGGCGKPGTPQEIDGKVMKVDSAKQEITLQDSNGTTHVMKAADETLKEYKAGDSIKATLRCK